jgi:hypothetical protein
MGKNNSCYQKRLAKMNATWDARTERRLKARILEIPVMPRPDPKPEWKLIPLEFDPPKPPIFIHPDDPRSRKPIIIPKGRNYHLYWRPVKEATKGKTAEEQRKEE